MMCANCGHAHTATEQAVRYTNDVLYVGDGEPYYRDTDVVESTLMICSEPGCLCTELDPTDAEDRVALIKAGEIDGN